LAVDVPSGLDATTGCVRGTVLPATRTVTFARRKCGHVLLPGRLHCRHVHVADIGISDAVIAASAIIARVNTPDSWPQALQAPSPSAHKYRRGHALVVSGPAHATGAARLAARGALRIGAGAVTMAADYAAAVALSAHLTAIMIAPYADAQEFSRVLRERRFESVLLGPALGVGADTRALVRAVLTSGQERPTVLDADALTSFEHHKEELWELTRSNGRVVMTPHEGEFVRLFGDLKGSKVDRAVRAAELACATVVLKGPDTVVAQCAGGATHVAINDNAPVWLATAGSGDVLAGFIAGLLAQGMPTFAAACPAVWLHGACANTFGPGLIAEDLPEALPAVLRALYEA
jgi:ADP-dependent NAD(P)H-hydrate dehydratase / NAD(P)H-hydrate epimerase